MLSNILGKSLIGIFLSTNLLLAQPIEKTKPLINVGLGFTGGGVSGKDSIKTRYLHYFHFKPYVGYYVTTDLEVGSVFEYLIRRSNIDEYSNEDGYGLGIYTRYNFSRFNPIRLVSPKTQMRALLYVQMECLYSTISYQDDTAPTFNETLNNLLLMPQIGLKLGVYKQLYLNFGIGYKFINGFQSARFSPIQPTFALEYMFLKKEKKYAE